MGEKGINKRRIRLGETKYNKQGVLMQIIEYNNANDISVKFDNGYNTIVYHNTYKNFKNGLIKDPYHPSLYGVGITGAKYQSRINYEMTPEYSIWFGMMTRCYKPNHKKHKSYYECKVCQEWLLFENFYEWLHSQDNFNKCTNENYNGWEIDKDILFKNNKIYSPSTCCLVPHIVNSLFIKRKDYRGDLPIGVAMHNGKYLAQCHNSNNYIYLGIYNTITEAFQAYKNYKENLIKQAAQEEYSKGNITKQCYEAMMKYKVEITD